MSFAYFSLRNKIFVILTFLLGFFLVIIPYQKVFFVLKVYNIIALLFLIFIIFFFNKEKNLFKSNQSYIYFLSAIIIFLPLLFFNIGNQKNEILILLKVINIFILLSLIFFIFLNSLTVYFIRGFIFATFISAIFAINQYYEIAFFYDIRNFFESENRWGDSFYLMRPPGLSYTSIQLSVVMMISLCILFYGKLENIIEKKYFYAISTTLLITPFLISAKILVVINFIVLLCYFFIKNKNTYNIYFISFILAIYLFFLSLFIIKNLPQYSRGITEKFGLTSINFENQIVNTEFFKNYRKKNFIEKKKNCVIDGIYKDKGINCDTLTFKQFLVLEKNIEKENLIPVFLEYSSHNSNINAFVKGGVFYFITTILFKLFLLYKTLSNYIKTGELDYLISFSFLLYLEIYSNFHNGGLATLSILYVPFYFLIFLQILYKKNFVKK